MVVFSVEAPNYIMKAGSSEISAHCEYKRSDGRQCGARAVHGSDRCFFHDPSCKAKRDAARKAGGIERSRKAAVLPADTPDKPLTSGADVSDLLAETINQVRRGQLDVKIAYTIGCLAGVLLKAREHEQLERRVQRLERMNPSDSTIPTLVESELRSEFESEDYEDYEEPEEPIEQ